MELKIYLRLLIKKWWIVLPTLLVTLALTIMFTFTQAPTYQAVATFIVGPNAALEDVKSFVSGLDLLSRRAEIATTYAEVANSRLIKRLATENLGLSSEQRGSLSVESQLVAGTNVVKITVLGNDPVLVRDFADAVGDQTVNYVRELYEPFDLTPLDRATLPTSPIKPDKGLNFALGAVLGLALGAGLAFLSEYLQAPAEPATSSATLDGTLAKDRKERYQNSQELTTALGEAIAEEVKVAMAEWGVERAPVDEVTVTAEEEEVPAWLREPRAEAVEEEEQEAALLEEVEAPVEEVAAPAEEEEVPAWMRELGVEAAEEQAEALVPIAELGLPTRIAGILRAAGIESVEGLLKTDENELLNIDGFGAKALEQVNASLEAKGFIKG